MQRCPHCQFPITRLAKTCGWCGAELRRKPPGMLVWFPWSQGPAEPHSQKPSADLINIPGMPSLTADATKTLADDPAATFAESIPGVTTRARAFPPPLMPATTLVERKQRAPTVPVGQQPVDLDISYTTPSPKPPPPPDLRPSWAERWWPALLLALPILVWLLTQDDHSWANALDIDSRLCLAGAVALGMWQLFRKLALQRSWRQLRAPLGAAVGLTLLSLICSLAERPIDAWQGSLLARDGNYPTAIAIYQRTGDGADAAQAQIAWGNILIDRGDYRDAESQIEAGLAHSSGAVHGTGRIALGRLYWLWGNQLLRRGDVQGAVSKWTLAGARAAGTPDGNRAVAALTAPQSVTGRAVWQGSPAPETHVTLVSSWAFSQQSHSLQTGGETLDATTGADGSFTIDGAKPGVTYALIWQGSFGNTTRVDAQGNPIYTVTIRPLQTANMGTITVG